MDAQAESSIYHYAQHDLVVLSPIPPVGPTEQEKTVGEQQKTILEQEKKIAEQAGHIETLSVRSKGLEDHARQLERDLLDYKALTDSRFDKMVALLASK